MHYYLALENFRLVDKNEYYKVNQVLILDDQYASSSRSLAAAKRAGWIRPIEEKEAKAQMKKLDKAKIQTKVIESKPKIEQPVENEKKDEKNNVDKAQENKDKVIKNFKVELMKPSDIADDIVDNDKIQDMVTKRREQRQEKETNHVKSTIENQNIKDAIDKKTTEKIKNKAKKVFKISRKKTKKKGN